MVAVKMLLQIMEIIEHCLDSHGQLFVHVVSMESTTAVEVPMKMTLDLLTFPFQGQVIAQIIYSNKVSGSNSSGWSCYHHIKITV